MEQPPSWPEHGVKTRIMVSEWLSQRKLRGIFWSNVNDWFSGWKGTCVKLATLKT